MRNVLTVLRQRLNQPADGLVRLLILSGARRRDGLAALIVGEMIDQQMAPCFSGPLTLFLPDIASAFPVIFDRRNPEETRINAALLARKCESSVIIGLLSLYFSLFPMNSGFERGSTVTASTTIKQNQSLNVSFSDISGSN